MKTKLYIVITALALCLLSVAADRYVAVMANTTTISIAAHQTATLSALCSQTPCNIHWVAILSNSAVGSLSATTGPQTVFSPGTKAGTAWIFASDGLGYVGGKEITITP